MSKYQIKLAKFWHQLDLSTIGVHTVSSPTKIAAVIEELAEKMKVRELVKAAGCYELAVVQRLGFILETLKEERLSRPLASWLVEQRPRLVLLHSDRGSEIAEINHRWCIKVNHELELATQ